MVCGQEQLGEMTKVLLHVWLSPSRTLREGRVGRKTLGSIVRDSQVLILRVRESRLESLRLPHRRDLGLERSPRIVLRALLAFLLLLPLAALHGPTRGVCLATWRALE